MSEENKEQEEKQKPKRKPKKTKVTLIKNIKYNHKRYKNGQEIEIDATDQESFIKAGIIKGE